jgi:hypothetical protein
MLKNKHIGQSAAKLRIEEGSTTIPRKGSTFISNIQIIVLDLFGKVRIFTYICSLIITK